ncbi:MAG: sulfotransferase domain-containing protein [Candidatus Nomurabacteria bacterium]|nr:MAG: sulfotransferase domain-containing protein [Candidatus Nomurabacteria bacterium]
MNKGKSEHSDEVWPNFLIIGEPRSGTTSLHDWLSMHPDLYMSSVKEPHYFSSINFPKIEKQILHTTRSKRKYLSYFKDGANKPFRGESSTYYLSDPEAPRKIKKAIPDVKLIAVLREPVDRAFSHYLLYNRRGTQQQSFTDVVSENLKGKTNPAYDLVELGRYYKHLKNYGKYFDNDQILVVLFDDLKKEPRVVIKRVLDFLGADTRVVDSLNIKTASNAYAQPRNKLSNALLSNRILTNIGLRIVPRPALKKIRTKLLMSGKKPEIDKRAETTLIKVYRKQIDQLEVLLNQDCSSLRRVN